MLASKTRWKLQPCKEEEVLHMKEELGVSALVAQLFVARGWKELDQARRFLNIDQEQFHDPFLLDGMEEAVERIKQGIQRNEKIRVYGDYDCDGVTSTTIMVHTLRELKAHFDFYIPNRFKEGYGLNERAIEKAQEEGVQLLITVDTGISALEQIKYASSLGVEVIVTDHHQPPEEIPDCVAVVNPKKVGCTYPYAHLSGAGLAFKLSQALLGRIPYELADVAAIGTIADLVPLTGENRLIAYHGLKSLNKTKHIGLQALMKVAGLEEDVVNEQHVGFSLGPRINVSGRLESAEKAVQLLLAEDEQEALLLAEEIQQLNKERQQLVEQMTQEAVAWVEAKYTAGLPKAIVVAEENWNVGVVGIVASKLVERYYIPVIVLSIDVEKGIAKGSARSIAGFDLYQALSVCQDLLMQYGGHTMAAGMTLAREEISAFRARLDQLAEQILTEEDLKPISCIDIAPDLGDITISSIDELNALAPYGVENPQPLLLLEQLSIKELRQVGADGKHLKSQFQQGEQFIDAIGFGQGELAHHISPEAKVDIIGHLSINEWNGRQKSQIIMKDIRVVERQFFDWRGARRAQLKWELLSFERGAALCYMRASGDDVRQKLPSLVDGVPIHSYATLRFDEAGYVQRQQGLDLPLQELDTFILLDLPQSFAQLRQICRLIGHGQKFYFMFQDNHNHFFSTLPKREHFKWYYAFLAKRGSFDLEEHGLALASHKGWSLDTVSFMTDVFEELELVRLIDGKIELRPQSNKRDLQASKIYQQKQAGLDLEQELLYSSLSQLKEMFQDWMLVNEKKEVL